MSVTSAITEIHQHGISLTFKPHVLNLKSFGTMMPPTLPTHIINAVSV